MNTALLVGETRALDPCYWADQSTCVVLATPQPNTWIVNKGGQRFMVDSRIEAQRLAEAVGGTWQER